MRKSKNHVFLSQEINKYNDPFNNGPCNLFLWNTETNENIPLWKSSMIFENPADDVQISTYERITAALMLNDEIYLGLNTGVIKKINEGTEIRRFPTLDTIAEKESIDFYRLLEIMIARDGFAINSLVKFNQEVYNASNLGLFCGDKKVIDESIYLAGVFKGDLGIISNGFKLDEDNLLGQPKFIKKDSSNIYDVFTSNIIAPSIAPLDGSGYKRGRFFIVWDKCYMFHGNWPNECRTVKSFPEGEVLEKTYTPNPQIIAWHNEKVIYATENEVRGVVYDDKYAEVPKSFGNIQDMFASKYLFLSVYDKENNISRIVNGQMAHKTLVELEGRVRFVTNQRVRY